MRIVPQRMYYAAQKINIGYTTILSPPLTWLIFQPLLAKGGGIEKLIEGMRLCEKKEGQQG